MFKKEYLLSIVPFACIGIGWLFYKLMFFFGGAIHGASFYSKIALSFICLLISGQIIWYFQPKKRIVQFAIVIVISLLSWYGLWASILSDFAEISFWTSLISPYKILVLYAEIQNFSSLAGLGYFLDTVAFFISIFYAFGTEKNIFFGPS